MGIGTVALGYKEPPLLYLSSDDDDNNNNYNVDSVDSNHSTSPPTTASVLKYEVRPILRISKKLLMFLLFCTKIVHLGG